METKFVASNKLLKWVSKSQRMSHYEVIIEVFMVALFGGKMILNASNAVMLALGLTFVIGLFLIMAYSSTIRKGRIISRTVSHLSFEDDVVTISTFGFRLFGVFNYSGATYTSLLSSLNPRNKTYPIMDKKIIGEKAIYLKIDGKNELLLLTDFFEKELMNHLKN